MENMKNIACCFTGHRDTKLAWKETEIEFLTFRQELEQAILTKIQQGCTTFYVGMAKGFDIWAAQMVINKKRIDKSLKLIAVIPYPEVQKGWSDQWQEKYQEVLRYADEAIITGEHYSANCFHIRITYMVDHSAHIIALYDHTIIGGTANTVLYAQKKGLDMLVINPNIRW